MNNNNENNLNGSENPLHIILIVAVVVAGHSLFKLFQGGGILSERYGLLTASAQQVSELLGALCFIAFYWKKSIWAWWVALISIPSTWVVFLLFQSLQPFMLAPALFYPLVVWYLIRKYKPYAEYIKR